MRIAGLEGKIRGLGLEYEDRGNVPVSQPETQPEEDEHARFLTEIAAACAELRQRVEGVLADGCFPLVVGGDHSIACGTVAGISSHYHRRKERVGLIWFDAHSDMNTPETSPSGNIHGMPLASCLGYGPDALTRLGERFPMVDARNAVLIGVRSVDKTEREVVRESGIHVYTMRDIDMHGVHHVMARALEHATDGTAGFHLSFDMDGTDPSVAPGVGTPVPGGTTLRESHLVMEHAADSRKLLGLEITEVDPILDVHNSTAIRAVDLVLSALGKSIL
jgi:arginase